MVAKTLFILFLLHMFGQHKVLLIILRADLLKACFKCVLIIRLRVRLQGYMSLDARIKTPRSDRFGSRRRRQKLNTVERVWAYETMRQLTSKAMHTADDTARTITLATVQQIGAQVATTSPFLSPVSTSELTARVDG